MALNTIVGSPHSDSYISVAEVISIATFLSTVESFGIPLEAVTRFSDLDDVLYQEDLVRNAAVNIDSASFDGDKLALDQARQWPRIRLRRRELETAQSVPNEVKWAQAADAVMMLMPQSEIQNAQQSNIESFSIGEQSVSFDRASVRAGVSTLHPAALAILKRGNILRGGVSSVRIPRG